VVFVLTSDDTHAPLAIRSLRARKHVFVEKPVSLSIPSVQSIIDAEREAKGAARVFVGYMRRYAPSYVQAFKREVASMPKILYARVRDFSGPNAQFVNQSGTFQIKGTDFPTGAARERNEKLQKLFEEAFPGQEITDEKRKACRFLGSLGSHDISLMRETLGYPEKVTAFTANDPFYNAIMQFRNSDGSSYSVTYESGIDGVPVFDAHLSVYGERKRVTIKVGLPADACLQCGLREAAKLTILCLSTTQYDSPYVKALPIVVEVDEVNDHGETQTRTVLSSYQDTYTAELMQLHECLVNGTQIKTTLQDAIKDLQIFDMMYKAWRV
jgi:predicted dehydrogenase